MSDNMKSGSFTKQASRAACVIPLINLGAISVGKSAIGSTMGTFILSGVVMLLFVAGIVFGVIGLVGSKQKRVKSILAPSLIGIILNVSFLSLMLFGAVSAYQETSEKMLGEDKVIVQSLLEVTGLAQQCALALNNKTEALYDNEVWNYDSLKEKRNYEERYKLINEAYTASSNCLDIINNIETYIDNELEKSNLSNDVKTQAKRDYLSGFNTHRGENRRVYEMFGEQFKIMDRMIKLLEENEEYWDVENGEFVSSNDDFLNEFNKLVDDISELDDEIKKTLKSINRS